MDDLTEGFHDWLLRKSELEGAVDEFAALFDAAVDIAGGAGGAPNIELVLSFLNSVALFKDDHYVKAITGWTPPFQLPTVSIKSLIALIRDYIHDRLRTFNPEAGDYLSGLLDFQGENESLDIFTLNYDRLVESMAARYGARFTTGFGDVWDPGLFDQKGWGVRVFKLHGSVDWYRVAQRSIIYQGAREHYAFPREATGELLLYPAESKVSHAEPYATLIAHFTRALGSAKKCIAIGYSFRDRDIKRIVLDQMATNRALQLLVVKPGAHEVLYQDRYADDEPTFQDFPDRVIGLWKGANEALQNRMIRYRLEEIADADHTISVIRDRRNARNFQDASTLLLGLIEKCRTTQMPGKPIPSLALTGAPEFRASLQLMLKRVLRWLLDTFGGPSPSMVSVPGMGLPYNRGGPVEEAFGMLVSLWLLSEGQEFNDEATEARHAIKRYVEKLLAGILLTTPPSGYEGWQLGPTRSDGTDRKFIDERADALKKLSNELQNFPPITAHALVSKQTRDMYKTLEGGLIVIGNIYEVIRNRGIQKLRDRAGFYYTPDVEGWESLVDAKQFANMSMVWGIAPSVKADRAALARVNSN
jgi:hypothetical protein